MFEMRSPGGQTCAPHSSSGASRRWIQDPGGKKLSGISGTLGTGDEQNLQEQIADDIGRRGIAVTLWGDSAHTKVGAGHSENLERRGALATLRSRLSHCLSSGRRRASIQGNSSDKDASVAGSEVVSLRFFPLSTASQTSEQLRITSRIPHASHASPAEYGCAV